MEIKLFKTKSFSKEVWEEAKAQGFKGLQMDVPTEIIKSADGKSYHAVFSTASKDRHGEIVYQNFDLKAFKKNPVYLDSHNYNSIESIIGKIVKIKSGEVLEGDIEFALDNPKGLLASKLAEGGFLNTSSIGFIPKEFDERGNITKSELLEISAVSVPANAEALFEKTNDNKDIETDDADEVDGTVTDDDAEGGEGDSEKGGEEIDPDGKDSAEPKNDDVVTDDKGETGGPSDEELAKIEAEGVVDNLVDNEEQEVDSPVDDETVDVEIESELPSEMLSAIVSAHKQELENKKEAVNALAKLVSKIKGEHELKRNIFKGLRDLLSKDIATK